MYETGKAGYYTIVMLLVNTANSRYSINHNGSDKTCVRTTININVLQPSGMAVAVNAAVSVRVLKAEFHRSSLGPLRNPSCSTSLGVSYSAGKGNIKWQ